MHSSWVALPLDSAPDELAHRVRHSYRLVRGGLPKKVQAALPPLSMAERPAL
jgi:predicted DNA-binding protein (MmcQ/YjbR family)